MKRMVQFATPPTSAIEGTACCHLPDRRKPAPFLVLALKAMRQKAATGPPSARVGLLAKFATEPETVSIFCDSFWYVDLSPFHDLS
jgi:hypothetical protein